MKATAPTRWLRLSLIVPGRNPRGTDFAVDDLVESLGRSPMLHNVVVRRLPGSGERYELVAGHRRVAAAKKKGFKHVEAKVIEADDLTAEQLALEENLRRKSLPDEGAALARLAELYEAQQPSRRGGDRRSKTFKSAKLAASVGPLEKVAQVIGQSVRDTRRKIRIAKLGSVKVKKALSGGRVNVLEAEKLVGLPKKEQDRQLAAVVQQKSDLPPELRRVRDALRYVEEHLRRRKPGSIAKGLLGELQGLARSVTATIEALDLSSGRRNARRTQAPKVATGHTVADITGTVSFEAKSYNSKLSMVGSIAAEDRPRPSPMRPYVSATNVSIQRTCPDECAFKSAPGAPGGCYADAGFSRIKIHKLDEAATHFDSADIIREEARQIDAAFRGGRIPQDGARGGQDLRLHVAGDVRTPAEAKLLGAAATRWRERGGGAVWTFTHSWREVPRSAWGSDVAVLASVESPRDLLLARAKGYASALVVEAFPQGDKAFRVEGAKKTRVIPCPAETRSKNCAACRLCLRPDMLFRMNAAIAFQIHGQQSAKAVDALRSASGR